MHRERGKHMEENRMLNKRENKLVLTERKSCVLNGIVDVIAFDVGEIILETDLGMLMMKGNGLRVNRLSIEKGEIDIEGRIDSLTFAQEKKTSERGDSLLARMFR